MIKIKQLNSNLQQKKYAHHQSSTNSSAKKLHIS
jgi:hypothetical protein